MLDPSLCIRKSLKVSPGVDDHVFPPTRLSFCLVRLTLHLSHLVGKPTMWFPNRSDTNRPVQLQKQARSFKFWS